MYGERNALLVLRGVSLTKPFFGGTPMHVDPGTLSLILGVLLGLSEALSLIPAVKANGIFQLIFTILQKLTGSSATTPPAV